MNDDIASLFSDLTTPDLADRARGAWGLYHRAHGGRIEDLIADLMHLADVDEILGGGAYAARRGAANYVAELPAWLPLEQAYSGACLAQTRPAGQTWITVGDGVDRRDVAEQLLNGLHRVGFHIADMSGQIADLASGHVLVSEQGHEFRVIANPAASA
ncbi:hypothetical protein [Streptomyces violarus]|uniref:hypothetical protein n=1 Tax=Streptomyces violarus TaxID=67380 RepID=UPI0021BFC36D|nr:hypothetical protein [Streptomyces violarus]MCT9142408.1 hypothetical protein [Streptomyces violarus]